ncbi:MAG: tetratricopeptide repeat protein [Candidatus Moranbacteria bacterium]|nr:tetratricopeptide repeat protein [Candidatus Moranbacteria bacterium]
MPLTAQQKRYIKKNADRMSPEEIARNGNIPEKEVFWFFKKNPSKSKIGKTSPDRTEEAPVSSNGFDFAAFLNDNLGIFISLSLLVFIAYFNALGNGFVSDDIAAIANNPDIGKFSNIFSYFPNGSVQKLLYFFAFHIAGLSPWIFRSINILAHLGSVFLVFTILSLLAKKPVAVMAAVLFAVHPILTESITWISGGPYALYSFFFLVSFLLYILSENSKKAYAYSILFFFLALTSSEKAMPLFLVFLLFEFVFRDLGKNWKKTIPYFSLSILWLFMFLFRVGERVSSVVSDSPTQGNSGLFNPFIQIPVAIVSYLKLIFWPAKLSLYQTEMVFSTGQYVAILLAFLVFLAIVFWSFKKDRKIFFWLSFFIVSLLVTLTPIKIAWVVAERYGYLGSIGIFVPLAYFFSYLSEKEEKWRVAAYSVFGILTIALLVRTIIRNTDWKNEDTLWVATAQVAPSGEHIHNNLGDVYSRQGDLPRAVLEFQKAIEINPRYADGYHNLGNTYQQMEDYDNAVLNYRKAIEFNPNLWQSYQGLAAIYFERGDYPQALENIQAAAKINPNDPDLAQNLQLIRSRVGK